MWTEPAVVSDVVVATPEAGPPGSASPVEIPPRSAGKEWSADGAARALAGLDVEQRRNAEISLEPFGEPAPEQLAGSAAVEALWASGSYDEAIRQLEAIEASGASFAVMIGWKEPVAVEGAKLYYPDVRVSTRTGGEDASLDFHAGSGNIFVLVVWSSGWSLHMSSDGGASFTETGSWAGFTAIAEMSVCGDFAWVGYTSTGDSYASSRFRRFDAETGLADTGYDFQVVADESPNTMAEIQVAGNAPDNNDRIYMAYLVNETDSVEFWWDDLSGVSFTRSSPPISNAWGGLDLAWNPFRAGDHARWISYLGTDGNIWLYRSAVSDWEAEVSRPLTAFITHTSLSAWSDHVYCAYECYTGDGYGICYLASNDAGATSWLADDAYWPATGEPDGFSPDISLRSGVGRAAVFSSETGTLDDVYYVTRAGWAAGTWSDPAWYNTYDHVSGDETYIEWLGTLGVSTYGMLYFDDLGGGSHGSPYFDLMHPRADFFDGFESGNLGGWTAAAP
ncbi:MAG TPA: hypothetical protein VLT32_17420 [Candidatus Sulfomarinibacteraceae bacterium]|nr:hypothetical protein [Candidatus Sulfomarinibacteraceae bacterium]